MLKLASGLILPLIIFIFALLSRKDIAAAPLEGSISPTSLYDATPERDDPLDANFFREKRLTASEARRSGMLATQLYPGDSHLDVIVESVKKDIAENATQGEPVFTFEALKHRSFYDVTPAMLGELLERQAAGGYVLKVSIIAGSYPIHDPTAVKNSACVAALRDALGK